MNDVGPEIFERLRLAMQYDDGMYCGDCSVDLGTRLGDGCVQCRCVELVMVHHTFHGSDLLKLPPECNKWSAYVVLDWSSADMAGGDLKMLVFCNSEWTVACVLEQDC